MRLRVYSGGHRDVRWTCQNGSGYAGRNVGRGDAGARGDAVPRGDARGCGSVPRAGGVHPAEPEHVPLRRDDPRLPGPRGRDVPAGGRGVAPRARRAVLYRAERLEPHRVARGRGTRPLPLPDVRLAHGLPHVQGEVRAGARGAGRVPAPERGGLRRHDRLHVAGPAAFRCGPRAGARGRRRKEPPCERGCRRAADPERRHTHEP